MAQCDTDKYIITIESYIFVNFCLYWKVNFMGSLTLVKEEQLNSRDIPQSIFVCFMNGNPLLGQGYIKAMSRSSNMSISDVWCKYG